MTITLLISVLTLISNPPSWHANINQAKQSALEKQVNILMVFAGSDWCRPCMQFKNNILLSEEFQNFEKDHLVVLYLDFPAKKKNKLSKKQLEHNEALADIYNTSGTFPKIILINAEGELNKTIQFTNQKVEDFIHAIR